MRWNKEKEMSEKTWVLFDVYSYKHLDTSSALQLIITAWVNQCTIKVCSLEYRWFLTDRLWAAAAAAMEWTNNPNMVLALNALRNLLQQQLPLYLMMKSVQTVAIYVRFLESHRNTAASFADVGDGQSSPEFLVI